MAPLLLKDDDAMNGNSRFEERAVMPGPVRFWRWNDAKVASGMELSEDGVFLRTTEEVSEGVHVTVRIELPSFPGMTVLGKVVRTVRGGVIAAAGIGIRFLDLTPSQRETIHEFIAQRALPYAA